MHTRLRLRTILAAIFAAALCNACASARSVPEVTHDGLQPVPASKMERVWLKPGEDFSQYSMIGMVDSYVAFKKNWQLNHPDLRRADLDRVRIWLTAEFRTVLTQKLLGRGYAIAMSPNKNVLIARISLIEVEVLEPNTDSDPDSITYIASTRSATLSVELYDSESGAILLRATDRGQFDQIGGVEVPSFATHSDDAQELLKHWVDLLVGEIDAALGRTDD